MSEYKIESRAFGSTLHHYVYKALGPWPFKNWSWQSVYDSSSKHSCEEWVRKTQFTESPEGQRIQLDMEIENNRQYVEKLRRRESLQAEGWMWNAERMLFINNKGEILIEPI